MLFRSRLVFSSFPLLVFLAFAVGGRGAFAEGPSYQGEEHECGSAGKTLRDVRRGDNQSSGDFALRGEYCSADLWVMRGPELL